jgi:hypothetical protein
MKKLTLCLVLMLSSFSIYSATLLDSLSDFSLQKTKLFTHELGVVSQFYKAVPNDKIWWGKGLGYNIGFKALRNMELVAGFFAVHSLYNPEDNFKYIDPNNGNEMLINYQYEYNYWRLEMPFMTCIKLNQFNRIASINIIGGYNFNILYIHSEVIRSRNSNLLIINKPEIFLVNASRYNNIPIGVRLIANQLFIFDIFYNFSSYEFGANHINSTFGSSNVSFQRMPYVQFNLLYRL